MILREIGAYLACIAVLGLLAHVLGESIRREWIHFDRFPYAPYQWENGGQFYKKLRIEAWKNALPDKSRYVRSMVRKSLQDNDMSREHIASLIDETCVAELIHVVLIFACPLFWLIFRTTFGLIGGILYGLSHVPFILIQRYNRARLVALYRKIMKREALIRENTHPIQQ